MYEQDEETVFNHRTLPEVLAMLSPGSPLSPLCPEGTHSIAFGSIGEFSISKPEQALAAILDERSAASSDESVVATIKIVRFVLELATSGGSEKSWGLVRRMASLLDVLRAERGRNEITDAVFRAVTRYEGAGGRRRGDESTNLTRFASYRDFLRDKYGAVAPTPDDWRPRDLHIVYRLIARAAQVDARFASLPPAYVREILEAGRRRKLKPWTAAAKLATKVGALGESPRRLESAIEKFRRATETYSGDFRAWKWPPAPK